MKSFIEFWKKDIINKLIVVCGLLLVVGALAFIGLLIDMPEGKSLFGAISEMVPQPSTPDPKTFTSTPEMTPTALPFNARPTVPPGISNQPTFTPESVIPTLAQVSSTATPEALSTSLPVESTSTATPSAAPVVTLNNDCIPSHTLQLGTVVEVLDGNTVRVLIDRLVYVVRYIGVAIPENKDYANAARIENTKLVYGKEVSLIMDVSDKDSRGRLLRYVLVGDVFVNLKLIQAGLGSALDVPPDSACEGTFSQAEQSAVNSQSGQWRPTATPSP